MEIEHVSWKHFIPQKGEDRKSKNGFQRYTHRINSEVGEIDATVLEQSFYGLHNFSRFKNEYSCINFYEASFILETWTNQEIDRIQPPKFSGPYLEEQIQALKTIQGKIENSSYGHKEELIRFWREKGTWKVPIIVIQSFDFMDLDFKKPFQLFEGHNRLAWVKFFMHNQTSLGLANEHFVWVIKKKNK